MKDFKVMMNKLGLTEEQQGRVIIASEQNANGGYDEIKKGFKDLISTYKPDYLILDNITTSAFYMSRKVGEQAGFIKYLKSVATFINCPITMIAHTKGESQMNGRLIEPNDVRGGKDVTNLSEFLMVLQRFSVIDPNTKKEYFYPTVRLCKHRGYVIKNNLFQLKFNEPTVSFGMDRAIPWDEFKEAFNNQKRL